MTGHMSVDQVFNSIAMPVKLGLNLNSHLKVPFNIAGNHAKKAKYPGQMGYNIHRMWQHSHLPTLKRSYSYIIQDT